MALLNILLIVGVTLPFVENAPSTNAKTPSTGEDLRSKVIFIDRDADTDSPDLSSSLYQPPKASEVRSLSFAKSVQTVPTLGVKASERSILSQMDDDRRIWGIVVDNKETEEDESFYNRPLVLPKTVAKFTTLTKKVVVKEVQKVETPVNVPKPSACDFSIVICCGNPSKLKECFQSQGCINATEDMFPHLCSRDSINRIIQDLGKYYKGNQDQRQI